MKHGFQTKAHNLISLFQGVQTLNGFMKNLEDQATIDPDRYDPFKYVGDGFEFFIELFLTLHPCDNRVGVYNYEPNMGADNGVDGYGINIRGEKSVVQVKYRSNTQQFLTANADHLSNLLSDGMLTFDVVTDNKDKKNFRHFVFTTATGLHFYTDQEMFKGKVKCIGHTDIRCMIDDNFPFWERAREIVKELCIKNGTNKEDQKKGE